MRRATTLVLALLLLAATACTEDPSRLVGPTWILDPSTIARLGIQVPAGTRVDIRFEGGQASGTTGCNTYTASYVADGADLSFSEIVATTRACDPALTTLEVDYLDRLAQTDSFQFAGTGASLILSGSSEPLGYTAEGSSPDRD